MIILFVYYFINQKIKFFIFKCINAKLTDNLFNMFANRLFAVLIAFKLFVKNVLMSMTNFIKNKIFLIKIPLKQKFYHSKW